MSETPIRYQFRHHRYDKLADQHVLLHGTEAPGRECDNCGKTVAWRDCYSVTPIDFGPWLAASPDLQLYKNFGPIRCGDCLPIDSIDAGEYRRLMKGGLDS